jgi:type IV pilus assembly protein PilV
MQRMKHISRRVRCFSMIEVLAAVLVLAVGVLGYAGLQARAMQSTGESYYRAQAMAVAQDLASRMQVNAAQLGTYTTAANWAGTGPTAPNSTNCLTASCTPAQIAMADITDIRYEAGALLTQGQVNVESCLTATNLTCIYVSWGGTQPTSGASGQCVNGSGQYVKGSDGLAPNCIMLEASI